MKPIKQPSEQKLKQRLSIEISFILAGCILVYFLSARFDILERIVDVSRQHEGLELDEIITVFIFLVFAMIVFSKRRWREIEQSRAVLMEQNIELKHALEEIKQLEGIIPICSSCKKIRNDSGFWDQVENYVETHSKAKFSHSLCPDCAHKMYGNEPWYTKIKHKKKDSK